NLEAGGRLRPCRGRTRATEARRRADEAITDRQFVEHEIVFSVLLLSTPHVAADDVDVAPDTAGAGVDHGLRDVQTAELAVAGIDVQFDDAGDRVGFQLDADPLMRAALRRFADAQSIGAVRP